MRQNDYGSLCTEMYELLHERAPAEELAFYLSYAEKEQKIFEPLCGSGRFLVPFLERGFDICGMDASEEMLSALKRKAPDARAERADLCGYRSEKRFDYIFMPSGSLSLFTDSVSRDEALRRIRELLVPGGKFVFAVDTVACRCADQEDFQTAVSAVRPDGRKIVLKTKNRYDPVTRTQFSPGIYELYEEGKLLKSEQMDFQTHLYEFGEMEPVLQKTGFGRIQVYASFSKEPAAGHGGEMLLYECEGQSRP